MALKPVNPKYYTYGISTSFESDPNPGTKMRTWYFNPKDSVFINAYNSGLTNKQLATRFFTGESAIEKHIRKLKVDGLIGEGKKLRPNLIKLYKRGLKNVKKWAKNPTFENWYKYFGRQSEYAHASPTSEKQVVKSIGRNIRAYFTGEKFALSSGAMIGGEETTRILDSLNAKKEIPLKAQNVLKTFTKDLFISKRADRGRGISTDNKLRNSFEKVIELNKEFKKNPGVTLTQLGKNLHKDKFINGNKETRLRLLTTISDDVAKYLQALTPRPDGKGFAREIPKGMSAEWSPPTGEKLKNIMARIASQTSGFRFQEGTLRGYKFSIRDAMLNLAPETTRKFRRVLEGTRGVVDEVAGLSATFKNAPGYTEFMQIIPDAINQQKNIDLDREFKGKLENALKGEFEGVKDFNKRSQAFAKKWKIDTPLINPGGDPTRDILYFNQMSKEAQANVLKIADKGKGFTISTTTLPVEAMGQRVEALKGAPALYKKFLEAVEHSPQTCRKILNYQTGGISTTCAAAINKDPVGAAKKLANLEATTGALGKVKNAARGFLGTLGKLGARGAPLAGLAVAGAAIEPLVKKFMIDDPTTYLTDESQMKGMLLATIEGETPKVDEEILKWQMPALGAATAAGTIPGAGAAYKARRGLPPTKDFVGPMEKGVGKTRAALGIKGVLGKALGATFSPLAVAATLPMDIAAQRKGGTEWGDIATDPLHWMGPAFASSGYEMASKGIKNPMLLKALRLGISPSVLRTVSSRFGLPGLAISAGLWGYDKWKNRSINDPDD